VTIDYVATADSASGQLVTDEMSVTIATPKPEPEPRRFNPIVLLIVLGLFLMIVALIVIVIIRHKRQKSRVVVRTTTQTALDRLDALKQEAGPDLKKFQTGLYPLLIDFARAQFGADLSSSDADEVVNGVAQVSGLSEDERRKLGNWVIRARRDKFSPVTGEPGEVLRLEVEIRSFLEKQDS